MRLLSAMASACLSGSLSFTASSAARCRLSLFHRRIIPLLRPSPLAISRRPFFTLPIRQFCVSPVQAIHTEVTDVPTDDISTSTAPPEKDPDDMKLYVGNLPNSCTEDMLKAEFSKAGHVDEVEILYETRTGKSCGFGFVTMGTVEEADAAIEMFEGKTPFPAIDENDHDGRPLRVIFAMRPMKTGPPPPQYNDNINKLFVGNLAWGVDQTVLEQVFSKHGKVMECKVVTDRETGRSRGFGFVTMSTEDEAKEAMTKLNGASVEGRMLRVNMAGDKPPPRGGF